MRRLTGRDQEWLWSELAHALRRQQPLPQALRDLAETAAGTRRGRAAAQLASAVEAGRSLTQSVKNSSRLFLPGSAAVIESGESSGNLADALFSLAASSGVDHDWRRMIVMSIAYPALVALVAMGVALYVGGRLPNLWGILGEWNIKLPAVSELMMHVSAALPFWLPAVIIALLVVPSVGLVILYVLPLPVSPVARPLEALRLHVPALGAVVHSVAMARWCGVMGHLAAARVPEAAAVRLAGSASGSATAAHESAELAERLDRGERLGEAMFGIWFFPPPLAGMVATAEGDVGHVHIWPLAEQMYLDQARRGNAVAHLALRAWFLAVGFLVVGLTVHSLVSPVFVMMSTMFQIM